MLLEVGEMLGFWVNFNRKSKLLERRSELRFVASESILYSPLKIKNQDKFWSNFVESNPKIMIKPIDKQSLIQYSSAKFSFYLLYI